MDNTFFTERTAQGTNQITLKSKLLEQRIIVLDDEVNPHNTQSLINQIILLATYEPQKPITMLINSPGGSIQDGLTLIDVMNSCQCVINTVSLGTAASMGAVILAAGTKGHRYISTHSQVMLHQPLLSGSVTGNCSEIEAISERLNKSRSVINSLLAEYTGLSPRVIDKLTRKDTYLDAQEALENHLVDVIANAEILNKLLTGGGNL